MSSTMTLSNNTTVTKTSWADDEDFDFDAWKATIDISPPTPESPTITTTTTTSWADIYHPAPDSSTATSWADDDSEDFDLEAWKATADTSAPNLDTLPPLQTHITEFLSSPSFTVAQTTSKPIQAAAKPSLQIPHWTCAKPMLAWRATQRDPDAPAYVQLSAWDNGVACAQSRVQYTRNWSVWKVSSGMDCRFPAQFRCSGLRGVECEEEEVRWGLDDVDVGDEERLDEYDEESGAGEEDVVSEPGAWEMRVNGADEGYCSDVSPLGLPTFPVKKNMEDDDVEMDEERLIDGCQEMLLGSRVERHRALHDVPIHSDGGAAKCWHCNWTTAALVTTAVVLSGSMYFLRRR